MQGRLQDFLTKIHADLTKEGGSQEYRRDVADKLTTTIAFRQAKVLNTIKSALNRAVNPVLEEVLALLNCSSKAGSLSRNLS